MKTYLVPPHDFLCQLPSHSFWIGGLVAKPPAKGYLTLGFLPKRTSVKKETLNQKTHHQFSLNPVQILASS